LQLFLTEGGEGRAMEDSINIMLRLGLRSIKVLCILPQDIVPMT
jgi:hypothetical protein